MHFTPLDKRAPQGYSLVEALIAVGILAGAIAAAASLSMAHARQDAISNDRSVATRYAESIARLWQLGFNTTAEMNEIMLRQTYGKSDETIGVMTPSITAGTNLTFNDDPGGASPAKPQGAIERATIGVTYAPSVNLSSGAVPTDSTFTIEVVRPVAALR
jgi:type II secretory pathway pseudopilin PulG